MMICAVHNYPTSTSTTTNIAPTAQVTATVVEKQRIQSQQAGAYPFPTNLWKLILKPLVQLYTRTASDTTSISETLARTPKPKIATETVTVSAGSILRKPMPLIATQTTTISEALTRFAHFFRALSETVAKAESLLRKPRPSIATQTTTISDSLVSRKIKGFILTETVTISELLKRKALPKVATQTTTVSESVARFAHFFRTCADTVSKAESILRTAKPKIATQSTTIAESLSRFAHFFRTLSESKSIADSLTRKPKPFVASQTTTVAELLKRKALPKIATETTSISDSLVKVKRYIRTIAETAVTISELLKRKALPKIATQVTTISDALSAAKGGLKQISVSDTVVITESIKRLVKRPIPVFSMYDDFEAGTYTYTADAQASSNGKWFERFLSGGTAGVRSSSGGTHAGSLVVWEKPTAATSSGQTFSTLITSTSNYTNFTLELDMRTIQQLRTGSTPNNWETAWVNWHWTDNQHLYYFVLKMSGVELGKVDTGGTQIILDTPGTPFTLTLNQWYHVKVVVNGNHFRCFVDGTLYSDYKDVGVGGFPAPPTNYPPTSTLYSGKVSLYCEDSEAEFDNVSITVSEGAAIAGAPESIAPLIRKAMPLIATQTVTVAAGTVSRFAHFFRIATDTTTIADSLVKVGKHFRQLVDSASISDSLTRFAHFFRSISQSTTLTGTVVAVKGKFFNLAQTVTVSDSLARVAKHFRAPTSENTTISESIARKIGRRLSDTTTIGELLVRVKGRFFNLVQTVTVSDSLARTAKHFRTMQETLTTVDSIKRKVSRKISTQTVAIVDNLFAGGRRFYNIFVTDAVSVSDSLSISTYIAKIISSVGGIGGGFAGAGERSARPVPMKEYRYNYRAGLTFTKDWTMPFRKFMRGKKNSRPL